MPWPDLPDDFRETNRSVWVDIPNELYDPLRGNQVYHQYMDQLEYADALGFDGIGVNEHHQNGYGLMPSPNIIAAGLARRTSPTLLVWGRDDAFIPPVYAERWQQLVPQAELAWIDEAGHMLTLEQPQAVANAIDAFLG